MSVQCLVKILDNECVCVCVRGVSGEGLDNVCVSAVSGEGPRQLVCVSVQCRVKGSTTSVCVCAVSGGNPRQLVCVCLQCLVKALNNECVCAVSGEGPQQPSPPVAAVKTGDPVHHQQEACLRTLSLHGRPVPLTRV